MVHHFPGNIDRVVYCGAWNKSTELCLEQNCPIVTGTNYQERAGTSPGFRAWLNNRILNLAQNT
jgi:hypothetical protein